MIRYARAVLILVNVALAAVLAWYWLDADGHVRNAHWSPPSPINPEWPPNAAAKTTVPDTSTFLVTLERPLFSPSRRPPPPPKPVTSDAMPEVDPLAGMQIVGIYGSGERGGIIASIDGKMQRKSVGQRVGPWELRSIVGREVTLVQGEQTRTIRISRVIVATDAPTSPASTAPPRGGPAVSFVPDASVEDARRDRIRRLNELRAKGGLPPLEN
jgi:hypothetical protein